MTTRQAPSLGPEKLLEAARVKSSQNVGCLFAADEELLVAPFALQVVVRPTAETTPFTPNDNLQRFASKTLDERGFQLVDHNQRTT